MHPHPEGPGARNRMASERLLSRSPSANSFPPRRQSFDLLRDEEEVNSGHRSDIHVGSTPSLSPRQQGHVPGPADQTAGGHHNGIDNKDSLAMSGDEHGSARKVARVGSFPIRRKSFDRIADLIKASVGLDDPAGGPLFTNTVSNASCSSHSNSNSSYHSGERKIQGGGNRRERVSIYPESTVDSRLRSRASEWHPERDDIDRSGRCSNHSDEDDDAQNLLLSQEWIDNGSYALGAAGQEASESGRLSRAAKLERCGNMSPDEAYSTGDSMKMSNWKYLLSLVKAKLLSNNGKGRKITILCGGLLSQTYEKTLRRYPGTLLTSMVTSKEGPLFYSDKVVLDRHPIAFVEILNAYREGVISEIPQHIAPETWIHELTYFQMHRAGIPAINNLLCRYGVIKEKGEEDEELSGSDTRQYLYNLLEEPSTSREAWCFSVVSLSMIIISVALVIIETIPVVSSKKPVLKAFSIIEIIIIAFFTIEYLGRLFVATRNPMNLIDVIAIVPSYVVLAFPSLRSLGGAKIFRVLRILRIFKLSRHSDGIQVLGKTAIACREELALLLFCLVIFSLLFSALLYFSEEKVPETRFESIPHAMWWAVVTITTVGYGDLAPETTLGRFLGSVCAVMGVVMVALPISVISSTFNEKFREHNKGIQVRQRREEKRKMLTSRLRARFFSSQGRGWNTIDR